MDDLIPKDAAGWWTMIGSLVAVISLIGGGLALIYRSLKRAARREVENVKLENERLHKELETRLRFPGYAKDVIQLTEDAAEARIKELESRYDAAIREKDQEKARALDSKVKEIQALKKQLEDAAATQSRLQVKLRSALVEAPPLPNQNAYALPVGLILLVKHNGKYGALQAVEQASSSRGAFIRYAWWFQPDGSGDFTNESVKFGFDVKGERMKPYPPMLNIGPIQLEWSVGGEGQGWVYFGPSSTPNPEYELVITGQVDISKINAEQFRLFKHSRFEQVTS